jgi:formamidopyrimidine-DNA glycosylase
MPELPEVETIRRQLDVKMRGRQVVALEFWKWGREQPAGAAFVDGVVGRTIERVDRRAKLLVFKFTDGGAMLGHLKMTGKFLVADPLYMPNKHDRALFVFNDGGRVVWSDVRQFGFVKLVTSTELEAVLVTYGPEPLLVTNEELAERLISPKTRTIKAALLNQSCIAGIGNIYADEACHRAGILPTRRLAQLNDEDRLRLAVEIKNVLNDSIAQKGTSANDYVDVNGERGGFLKLLRVYGRENEPCRTCTTLIAKIFLAQRGTHYCSICQT